jgi:hypothetical protein
VSHKNGKVGMTELAILLFHSKILLEEGTLLKLGIYGESNII